MRYPIGQMFGIVGPGLIFAQHVFRGLNRDMYVRDDGNAAASKLAVTWSPPRDARFVGDRFSGHIDYMQAPQGKIFAVYLSVNEMLDDYPDVYGWAEQWTWIAEDAQLAGAPIDWNNRYDEKVWSRT
jgi:hypothetical protein